MLSRYHAGNEKNFRPDIYIETEVLSAFIFRKVLLSSACLLCFGQLFDPGGDQSSGNLADVRITVAGVQAG